MLSLLRTSPAFRLRLAPALLTESTPRRADRQMAVPVGRPTSKISVALATSALLLTTTSLWHQDQVLTFTHEAVNGLGIQQAYAADWTDPADVPAMDSRLAQVVDPRPRLARLFGRRTPAQTFEYEVRPGETADEIAARFGTDVAALLWNNGLDSADQIQPGAKLTLLPVGGILHLVQDGDTLTAIAERYGARIEDLIRANAIADPDHLLPGQVLIVAGGAVPNREPAIAQQPAPAIEQAPLASVEQRPAPTLRVVVPQAPAMPAPAPSDDHLPTPPNTTTSQRQFILSVAPGARQSMRETGVPASVTLAQAILESDWGRSKLTREAKNLFGIKALRDPGTAGIYNIETWEVIDGEDVIVMAGFKAYKTLADSISDHGRWFLDNSRYRPALKVKDDPKKFAQAINDAGYATDPAYAPKLITLMDKYNLYAYDVK